MEVKVVGGGEAAGVGAGTETGAGVGREGGDKGGGIRSRRSSG